MNTIHLSAIVLGLSFASAAVAQTTSSPAASSPTAVPALVPYSGLATDSSGKPLSGERIVTILVYKDESGGEPLFAETQTVLADSTGRYKLQMGATLTNGLPIELFSTGEARWLELQIAGEKPQPRVLLASVPYALKAADAATLGGLPASAFALAGAVSPASAAITASGVSSDASSTVTTPGGSSGFIPVFTGTSAINDSVLFQNANGIGIKSSNPGAALDVAGKSIFRGGFELTRSANATASTGTDSYPISIYAQAYNSSSKTTVNPYLELQAEPTGNNTSSPGATLHLLYDNGSGSPSETGFYLNGNGTIHFATGQTFGATSSSGVAFNGASASNTGVEGTSSTGSGAVGDTAGTTLGTAGVLGVAGKRNTSGFNGIAAIWGDSASHVGVYGSSDQYAGVFGQSASGVGVQGSSASANGVYGFSSKTSAIHGETQSASAGDAAIYGGSDSVAAGVIGVSNAGIGGDFTGGLQSSGNGSSGLRGTGASSSSGNEIGGSGGSFYGGVGSTYLSGNGVEGTGGNGSDYAGAGVVGQGGTSTGEFPGSGGTFLGGYAPNNIGGDGVYAIAGAGDPNHNETNGLAGSFSGDVSISGTLSADEKDFRIDHPADPANKYLVHASIESSEMVNIYSGNAVTDELGLATVRLPNWFETLNGDLRYQLTVVGRKAQAWISQEVKDGKFQIASDATNTKVSWQITGVRQDAYARAHPLVVEESKNAHERGFYKHPELYGQPAEKQTEWGRHPELMRRLKAQQSRTLIVAVSRKAETQPPSPARP